MAMGRVLHPSNSVSLENLAALYGLSQKSVPYNILDGLKRQDIGPRLLEETGLGAIQDCALTLKLFERMKPQFPPEELSIIDMTIQTFTNPRFVGDAAGFRSLVQAEQEEKARMLAALGVEAEDLHSNDKFQALLEAQEVEIEYKQGKNGDIPAFASRPSATALIAIATLFYRSITSC